jgi:hypothetical protein
MSAIIEHEPETHLNHVVEEEATAATVAVNSLPQLR